MFLHSSWSICPVSKGMQLVCAQAVVSELSCAVVPGWSGRSMTSAAGSARGSVDAVSPRAQGRPAGARRHLDADEAVALGAGLFAANLSTTFRLRKFGMSDGATHPLAYQVSPRRVPDDRSHSGTHRRCRELGTTRGLPGGWDSSWPIRCAPMQRLKSAECWI